MKKSEDMNNLAVLCLVLGGVGVTVLAVLLVVHSARLALEAVSLRPLQWVVIAWVGMEVISILLEPSGKGKPHRRYA